MLSRARLGLLLAAGFVAGCGSPAATSGYLSVTVSWDEGVTAPCFRVQVRPEGGGTAVRSGPLARPSDRSSLVVAVYQDALPTGVRVEALGFADEACTLLTEPLEASSPVSATFRAGKTVDVSLRVHAAAPGDGGVDAGTDAGLDAGTDAGMDAGTDAGMGDAGVDGGADAGVDADQDGSPFGVDCDDNDPQRFPGNPEVCSDRRDNDCDLQPDCMDTDCNAMGCGTPSANAAQCQGGVCVELTCADGVSNDDDALIDCADPDCDGRACPNAGTCVAMVCNTNTEICNDGVNNNDGDSLVDCADPDCAVGVACTDGDACTMGETCQAGGTCGLGTPLACAAPACFVSLGCDAGLCLDQPADAGASCDDGVRCTTNDRCDGDGGCGGDPVTCPNVGACFVGTCIEADGGCGVVPDVGAVCSDSDACTDNDACAADGGCEGTPITCPSPGECQTASGCDAVMGCTYAPRTGLACDGGTCNALGQCQPAAPTPVYPYTPSNFAEADVASVDAGPWVVSCLTTVATQLADGGVQVTSGCAEATPPHVIVTQAGGLEAAVLVTQDFTLAASGTLRAEGARPLIIAVKGTATLAGLVDVDGDNAAGNAAGAGRGCNGGTGGAGATAGRGGGGGGGAFGANASAGGTGGDGTAAGGGGTSVGNATLVPLRGGCAGGAGGGATTAAGGRGGGALQVSAAGALTVSGILSAGGAGGRGAGLASRGGGGGGSGGAILLEGTTLTVGSGAVLAANGGEGGEGSGAGGLDPNAGRNGVTGPRSTAPAAGGAGASYCGGDSGRGGARAGISQAGVQGGLNAFCFDNGGGGGGGGSVGRIRLNASTGCTLGSTNISPRHTGNGPGCP